MGNMTGLRALNLSHNLLECPLPLSFQNMENLESMDLSHNKLTGKIPQEITKLNFLGTFSVAFNNLLGEIPSQGHFSTFTMSSYEGNSSLCGIPLAKKIARQRFPWPPTVRKEEDHGILDSDLFFYSCVAISYWLGFGGFIASRFFNKNWRRKFFMWMDEIQDWCFVKFWRIVCYIRNQC